MPPIIIHLFHPRIIIHLFHPRIIIHLFHPRIIIHLFHPRIIIHLFHPRIIIHLFHPRIIIHLFHPRIIILCRTSCSASMHISLATCSSSINWLMSWEAFSKKFIYAATAFASYSTKYVFQLTSYPPSGQHLELGAAALLHQLSDPPKRAALSSLWLPRLPHPQQPGQMCRAEGLLGAGGVTPPLQLHAHLQSQEIGK